MGKTVIKDAMFPAIIEKYNREGKSAAYAMLREEYGIRHPATVISRIRRSGAYGYDAAKDRFSCQEPVPDGDGIFLGLDELCAPAALPCAPAAPSGSRQLDMEGLVQELIGDRLLALSRYITMDTPSRTVLVDRTSLLSDGYRVVLH